MKTRSLAFLLLLSSPALADGAHFILSWICTGGPLATFIAAIWGVRKTQTIAKRGYRWAAKVLAVVASLCGYALGFVVLMGLEWPASSPLGLLFGPALFAFGLVCGYLPGFMFSLGPEARRVVPSKLPE